MLQKSKRFACSFITLLLVIICAQGALCCTGFYVGKEASKNGAIIIGHTVDAFNTFQSKQVVYPHCEEPGRMVAVGKNNIPLPDVTYQYTAIPFLEGIVHSSAANEMGLAVTGAITTRVSDATLAMDPYVADGAGESWICGYLAATSASAREAVENYGKITAEYGSCESNIFLIADQNEAWYLESYSGHQWCAVKAPDDCVAVVGNENLIGTLDAYIEGETLLHSPDLFAAPEAAGLTVRDENGNVNLFDTYSGVRAVTQNESRRTWYGHKLLAPSTAGSFDASCARYPLFYQPDDKVSVEDIFELTRSRFEGTEWNPEDTGRPDIRVIGIERQTNCSAIEIYPELPAAMCAVTWTTLANAEHSVYLPIDNLVTSVAPMFSYSPEGFTVADYGYCLDYAHTHFKRLCALSEQNRKYYGVGVRDYWKGVENAILAEYPDVLAKTASLYADNPVEAAKYITSYTVEKQEKALADCDLMYDELTWYMIANTHTMTYNTSIGDFNPIIPFVPSIAASED